MSAAVDFEAKFDVVFAAAVAELEACCRIPRVSTDPAYAERMAQAAA